jgi:effector-binding domain-containing protein
MMRYMQDNGIEMTVPAWEIYLDDADEVPEDALRTEVFVALK